jgi:hypothetical protein
MHLILLILFVWLLFVHPRLLGQFIAGVGCLLGISILIILVAALAGALFH